MDLEKYRSSIRLGRRAGNGCAGETLANLRASRDRRTRPRDDRSVPGAVRSLLPRRHVPFLDL